RRDGTAYAHPPDGGEVADLSAGDSLLRGEGTDRSGKGSPQPLPPLFGKGRLAAADDSRAEGGGDAGPDGQEGAGGDGQGGKQRGAPIPGTAAVGHVFRVDPPSGDDCDPGRHDRFPGEPGARLGGHVPADGAVEASAGPAPEVAGPVGFRRSGRLL